MAAVESFIAGDTSDEAKAATAVIRAFCGWHIAGVVAEVDEPVDTDGGRVLLLDTLRLVSVEAVTDRDAVPIIDFTKSRRGMLARDGGWPSGFEAVTVSFTHGYADVPAELSAAARSLMGHYDGSTGPLAGFTKTQGSKSLSKTFSVGTAATLVGGLSMVERMVLNRYALGSRA